MRDVGAEGVGVESHEQQQKAHEHAHQNRRDAAPLAQQLSDAERAREAPLAQAHARRTDPYRIVPEQREHGAREAPPDDQEVHDERQGSRQGDAIEQERDGRLHGDGRGGVVRERRPQHEFLPLRKEAHHRAEDASHQADEGGNQGVAHHDPAPSHAQRDERAYRHRRAVDAVHGEDRDHVGNEDEHDHAGKQAGIHADAHVVDGDSDPGIVRGLDEARDVVHLEREGLVKLLAQRVLEAVGRIVEP